jgi:hypothetical protein
MVRGRASVKKPRALYWLFIILAFLYFFILYYFFGVTFDKVHKLPANELGDFLAGAFSPLAFLFLILGYLQNTNALKLQGEEIKKNSKVLQHTNQPKFKFEKHSIEYSKDNPSLFNIKITITNEGQACTLQTMSFPEGGLM